jgi:hypothetical protein
MRKITETVCGAFLRRKRAAQNNTTTDGTKLWLHGNLIAEWRGNELWITNCGYFKNVTKERLNALGADISQKKGDWFFASGTAWDGDWTRIYPEGL